MAIKVLVTGAAGFIGSNLLLKLLERNIQTVAVDNFSPYLYESTTKEKNWEYVNSQDPGRIKFYRVDLLEANLQLLLQDVTHVVHLAALPGQSKSWELGRAYWENNVLATHLLLKELINLDIKLIFASSSSIYGDIEEGNESFPKKPISPYGVTKLAAEHLIEVFENSNGSLFKSVILRLFSVYGPRQRPDMGIYRFIDSLNNEKPIRVFGDGGALRTFTYIDDVISAIITSIDNEELVGKFNICGNQVASVADVIDLLAEITSKSPKVIHVPAREGDQRVTQGDARKAEEFMGFDSSFTLKQGLIEQVLWQNSQQSGLET